jgi:regulator of protease activity HflC (stomatin/prohibitin superfamily)
VTNAQASIVRREGQAVRSVLAIIAVVWFVWNTFTFIPQGAGVIINPGQVGGIDGDPGAVAVTWAARTLFAGLALMAAALVDWGAVTRRPTPPPVAK